MKNLTWKDVKAMGNPMDGLVLTNLETGAKLHVVGFKQYENGEIHLILIGQDPETHLPVLTVHEVDEQDVFREFLAKCNAAKVARGDPSLPILKPEQNTVHVVRLEADERQTHRHGSKRRGKRTH